MLTATGEAQRACEAEGHLHNVMLVSDVPPCLNYSGGILIDRVLASISYRIRHCFIVLNPYVRPELPPGIEDKVSFTTVSKPNEVYYPEVSSVEDIRSEEVASERHVRDVILPELLRVAAEQAIGGYWVILEGQSMIRLAHALLGATDLPITVQIMDPPHDWLRVHSVDEQSRAEVLQQYEHVLRQATACACASWAMAERYEQKYGTPCFPVVPSLPEELARQVARAPKQRGTFKLALAGQIYAREEWNTLISALAKLARTKHKQIEVHAFTREPVEDNREHGVAVHVHPWMPTEELLDALQEMDLLYCPYRFGEIFREESELCFPSKLTTYLASGTAVLFHGPEYASPAQFLKRWDAAFACYSQDPDDLASTIGKAIARKNEYERIAANGAKAFRERLSYGYLSGSIRAALSWRDFEERSVESLDHRPDRAGVSAPVLTPGHRKVVLVIGMAESIHVARWVNMVSPYHDLQVILCPVFRPGAARNATGHVAINPDFKAMRIVRADDEIVDMPPGEIGIFDLESVAREDVEAARRATQFAPYHPSFLPSDWGFTEPGHVAAAIRRFRPGLVVSLEVQFAGYLALATKEYLGGEFPRWLLSNWGSDIYLYRKLKSHEPKLRRIAESIDAYIAECHRDVAIVRQMGFRGVVLPTMPASGGVEFSEFPALGSLPPPSARREIQIKGYHGWSGRGLHILAAVHLAADALSHFAIRITLAGPEVQAMAERMARHDRLDIACEPYVASHSDSIARLARARLSVGLGISDGISTTLLESMAVGTFPIKGTSSCACEWIESGRTGIIVSPHDTRALADALVRGASDDALVDAAAHVNRTAVEQRWDAARNGEVIAGHLLELAES